jgi:hypothetical protein
MSAFETVLRQQVIDSQQALLLAEQTDDFAKTSMHSARLLDLLDRAANNGIDTTAWISAELSLNGLSGWQ